MTHIDKYGRETKHDTAAKVLEFAFGKERKAHRRKPEKFKPEGRESPQQIEHSNFQ